MSDLKDKEQPSSEGKAGLDRRGFLKISSAAAATAAVAGTSLATGKAAKQKSQPTKRPAGAAKDLKGGWFVV